MLPLCFVAVLLHDRFRRLGQDLSWRASDPSSFDSTVISVAFVPFSASFKRCGQPTIACVPAVTMGNNCQPQRSATEGSDRHTDRLLSRKKCLSLSLDSLLDSRKRTSGRQNETAGKTLRALVTAEKSRLRPKCYDLILDHRGVDANSEVYIERRSWLSQASKDTTHLVSQSHDKPGEATRESEGDPLCGLQITVHVPSEFRAMSIDRFLTHEVSSQCSLTLCSKWGVEISGMLDGYDLKGSTVASRNKFIQ